jgi:hypothetical protein
MVRARRGGIVLVAKNSSDEPVLRSRLVAAVIK